MNVTHALVCGLSGSRAVCPFLMRSASCMYPLMSIRPELRTINYRTGKRFPRTNITCAFIDRSSNVLTISYTVHIRCVRFTSITRTLVDHSLSVSCSAHMRSLQLP